MRRMTVNDVLTPVIKQEFEEYERNGYKIKLKSVFKRRVKYSIICGIFALLGFINPGFLIYAAIVYTVLMLKTRDNVKVIISLAKKEPDKAIKQIIAEEIKA